MDPASAIGIAAGVLAFLDFGLKVLHTCREIKEDAENATKHNKLLEQSIKAVRDHRRTLETLLCQSGHKKRLLELSKACTQDAEDLLKLLVSLRDVSGKPFSVVKAAFKAITSKRTIEKLHNALKAKEARLSIVLNQDMHMTVEQLRTDQEKLIYGVTKGMSALETGLKDMSVTADEVLHNQRLQALLDSLHFPEIDFRASSIKRAHDGTAEWIFNTRDDSGGRDSNAMGIQRGAAPPQSNDFVAWLEQPRSSSGPVYWISGKAASGKSTLMAHILHDERLRHSLQIWAGPNRELHVLAHFFWRSGSLIQRSLLGLLKTILYQMVQIPTYAKLAATLQPRRFSWTPQALINFLRSLLQHGRATACCCFMIDGLDEYDGEVGDLVELLTETSLDAAKYCVSSRREWQLKVQLDRYSQLRMEDYNHADILALVSQKLSQHAELYSMAGGTQYDLEQLSKRVASRASGMFLWAVLVTNSVIRGLQTGDTMQTIDLRIDAMPREMEMLLRQMMDSIDELQRPMLRMYFEVLTVLSELFGLYNVLILTNMRLPNSLVHSYMTFLHACHQTVLQIEGQSAGLLELQHATLLDAQYAPPADVRSCRHGLLKNAIAVPSLIDAYVMTGDKRNTRTIVDSQDCYSADFARFEDLQLTWTHRAAGDLVKKIDLKAWSGMIETDLQPCCARVRNRCFLAITRLICDLPSRVMCVSYNQATGNTRTLYLVKAALHLTDIHESDVEPNTSALEIADSSLGLTTANSERISAARGPGLSDDSTWAMLCRLHKSISTLHAYESAGRVEKWGLGSVLADPVYTVLFMMCQGGYYLNGEYIQYFSLESRHRLVAKWLVILLEHDQSCGTALGCLQAVLQQHDLLCDRSLAQLLDQLWHIVTHMLKRTQVVEVSTRFTFLSASYRCFVSARPLTFEPRAAARSTLQEELPNYEALIHLSLLHTIATHRSSHGNHHKSKHDLGSVHLLETNNIGEAISVTTRLLGPSQMRFSLADDFVFDPLHEPNPGFRNMIFLQIHASSLFRLVPDQELEDSYDASSLRLRLVCWPRGAGFQRKYDTGLKPIFLDLSRDVSVAVLEARMQAALHVEDSCHTVCVKFWRYFDAIREILRAEIWCNQQGLSATDQLLTLACLRKGLPAYFYYKLGKACGIPVELGDLLGPPAPITRSRDFREPSEYQEWMAKCVKGLYTSHA